MTRIAHISDLHFSKITLTPLQFLSKRCIGNANLVFSRRNTYIKDQLLQLPDLFASLGVGMVLFTGDASTTGRKDELEEAALFLKKFQEKGMRVLSVPGNHDHYTRKDYKNRSFYDHLQNPKQNSFSLKDDFVEIGQISDSWWYLALDTVLSTPFYSSQGLFSETVEQNLLAALKKIPDVPIIMINHFPFFQFDTPRKALKRGMVLHDILRNDPRVQIYAHGHTHRHCIADLRVDHLPIILDSGSTAHKKIGSFHLLDLDSKKLDVTVYKTQKGTFKEAGTSSFTWS